MNLDDLQKILARIKRIRARVEVQSGDGAEWSVKFSDGEIHEYAINGIKPFEEFEDDIENIFVWLWSLKDYVKQYAINKGRSGNWVEQKVNADENLCICADIANRSKHGQLNRSRSQKHPKLGSLSYELPHGSFNKITVYAHRVETDVSKPDEAILKMDVLDDEGNVLSDAFELLNYCLQSWEGIIVELDSVVTQN